MNRTDDEVIEDKNRFMLWKLLYKRLFWDRYERQKIPPRFDFSDAYGEIDVGQKAWRMGSPRFLPVGANVSRRNLEKTQRDFWAQYMETL